MRQHSSKHHHSKASAPLTREGYKRKNLKVKWVALRALQYPVYNGKKCVIPAGTTGVECSFGTSHLQRYDEKSQKWVYMNMYRYNDKIYHA